MIREIAATDIDNIVSIHMASFPSFFLTFLGADFLRIYYSSVIEAEDRIAFVSYDENAKIQGFVVGSINPQGFYSRLLIRRWYKFAWVSILPVLRKPLIIGRLLRALTYPANTPAGNNICGLFSICVSPSTQLQGVGHQLVEQFIQEAKNKGCQKVFLTTDKKNNDYVNGFYQKMGFYIEREYITPEGREMNYYSRHLMTK